MDGSRAPTLRKRALNLFLASIGINAVLGIWALLAQDFGSTQGKILTTSFLVSAAMLGVLVNGTAMERRVFWPLPLVSASMAVTGFGLLGVMVWTNLDHEWIIKTAVSALILGAGGTLLGLLELVRLRPNLTMLRLAYRSLIGLLSVTSIFALWAEVNADWLPRLIGVESILVAAVTLAIPALSRFLPPSERQLHQTASIRFCPSCGAPVTEIPIGDGMQFECLKCDVALLIEPTIADDEPGVTRQDLHGQ